MEKKFTETALFKTLVCLGLGAIVYFLIPVPEFLQEHARAETNWRLLAIFVATLAALILAPLPMGAIAIIAIATVTITRTVLPIGVALSGFSDGIIWLIVSAFLISRGFIKTGLGERIAYLFMSKLGKKTLGLTYSLVLADLVIAPTTPSNTARAGGIIFPIVRSLNDAYNSKTEDGTQKRLASFLTYTIFQTDNVICSMFLTAMAASGAAVAIASSQFGIEITWAGWFLAALVPGIITVLLVPLFLYKIYPPEIKETPQAVEMAKQRLSELGKMKPDEWKMIGVFVMLLTMWILSAQLNINATVTAFCGLAVMLITKVLTIEDIKTEKEAWNTLIWFAVLVMMATQLNVQGIIPWITESVAGGIGDVNWVAAFIIICVVYYYSHYLFASATAHVAAMYAAMVGVAIAVGVPPMLAALVIAFITNLHMGITHYGTGPAPVYFGPGYVTLGRWWGNAFLLSLIHLLIWFPIGLLWWRILGHW